MDRAAHQGALRHAPLLERPREVRAAEAVDARPERVEARFGQMDDDALLTAREGQSERAVGRCLDRRPREGLPEVEIDPEDEFYVGSAPDSEML